MENKTPWWMQVSKTLAGFCRGTGNGTMNTEDIRLQSETHSIGIQQSS